MALHSSSVFEGRRLPQNLESALDSYPLDRRIYKEIALDGVGRIIGIERHGLAVLKDDEAIFVGEPKLFGSQELLGSAVYDLHQPTRVRPGGALCRRRLRPCWRC
jgi:hypothetical protein